MSVTSANSSHDTPAATTKAKMRRLKIQEDLLIQSIKKTMPNSYSDGENKFIKSDLQFKKYLSELKKSYADIKRLFQDVKCTTKSQEILKTLDIDDIKKDVLELDNKIKAMKSFFQRELTELKKSEKDLIKQLEDDAIQNIQMKKSKVIKKSYSDIIPSPVRTLINSPLKSPEVQEFQDFLGSSSKYGGWNEFNHNIFVRIWQKHFQTDDDYVEFEKLDYLERDIFFDEVIEKISGVKKNDIISHIKWYSKYLYLKKRQNTALNEWRAKTKPKIIQSINKRGNIMDQKYSNTSDSRVGRGKKFRSKTAKGLTSSTKSSFSSDGLQDSLAEHEDKLLSCVGANEFFKEMDHVRSSSEFGYAKPTIQWKNRQSTKSDFSKFNRNLEDISKLGVPSWRFGLAREE